MPIVLRARAVWKSYAAGVAGCSARVWVLRGANLDVAAGECVAVLGARGSGTTTLLHCLAGLRRPDAGTIERALDAHFVGSAASADTGASIERDCLSFWDDCGDRDDSTSSREIRLRRLGRGAALIATHELARVRDVADRVLLLRDGRLTELDRTAGVRRVAERRVVRAR